MAPKICLLIENSTEQELIKEILGSSFSITITDSPVKQNCDLFICSISMFDKYRDVLKSIKETSDPIFIPVLLITFKTETDLMLSDLHEIIDEVITAPVTVSKLIPKIQILLRMRSQSLQLHNWHTQCIKREQDLKIAHQQLTDERNFSNAIINTQGALVAVLNPQAEIVRFNKACERTTGYTFEEVKGHKFWDFFAKEELDSVKEKYDETFCGKPSEYENYMVSKTGQKRVVNWRNTLICNDHVEYIIATGVDITDRRNTEQKLQDSENRLKIAQQAAKIGTFEYNFKKDVNIWTPELEAIHGLSPGQLRKDSISWESLVHPEDRDKAWEKVRLTYNTGEPVSCEWRVIWPNGSVHWVQAGFQAFFDSDGKPSRLIGVNLDITDRKRAEQALRESERNLEEAQRITHVGNWVWNVETSELFCSAETFRIYGEEPFSFQPTLNSFLEYVHTEDREYVKESIAVIQSGSKQRIDHEFRIIRKDGSIRYIHSIGEIREFTSNGKPYQIRGTGQDITERKKAEEALRNSEARLKRALSIKTVGVLFFRLDGHITGANATFERISGYSSDELQKISHWKRLTTPEFWEETMKTAGNLATLGETPPYEKQMFRKDGSRWWGLFSPTRLSGYGINTECVEFIIDITERKQAEEALQRYTNKLAASNRDLESFSYSVSHDLRSPLGLIGGFTSLLIDDYSEKLDEEGRDYLRLIDNSVKKMQTLINDILALSRIGRQEMNRVEVNLSATVKNYLAELKSMEPDRKVECSIQDNVHANADPKLIHLALENLIRNAWKFTAKKETAQIEFGVIEANHLLQERARWQANNQEPVYFIRDNGIGFDMKFARTIFEPFKRVPGEKDFGGTGVGLSIVQRVVEKHGGKVWAEGKKGEGASFYFTLS